jgi:DNA-binding LacI/PurR family transcriptional regulator
VFLTQQVALVGFEDMLHVNLTSPSFTYVSSASETGRQAAGLIIRKLKEPELQNGSPFPGSLLQGIGVKKPGGGYALPGLRS